MNRIKVLIAILFLIIASFIIASLPVKANVNHIVISEIQVAGATASDEFVELYNPTQYPVDITGWRLSKKTSTGTQSNLVTTMGGVIAAYGYRLITPPTGYTGIPAADATYSTSATVTDNNTIILYSDAGTTVVDKVGFGTATDYESSAFPSNPPAGGSIERISNIDTDNNSVDFTTKEVSNPQNSSFVEPIVTPTETSTPTEVPTATPTESPISTEAPTPTASPTPIPTVTPISTPTVSPTPTEIPTPTEAPTATPTENPTIAPTQNPTNTPTINPTTSPTPNPVKRPPGWSRSPLFTCTNPHIPSFVYALLKFFMPWKFHCAIS